MRPTIVARRDRRSRPRVVVFEQLESRRLLALTKVPWTSEVTFNQFTGGAPSIIGFGIDDGQADLNGDGISDATGVARAPRFLGFDWDTGRGSTDLGLGEVYGQTSGKIGFNYGFGIFGGVASALHQGTFSYDVSDPDSTGSFRITTDSDLVNGALYTTSPNISAFADLAVKLNMLAGARFYSLFPWLYDDVVAEIPVNTDFTLPLLSVNRQEQTSDGRPAFNSNGTPKFDGDIKILGDALLPNVQSLLRPGETSLEDQYQKDLAAQRQAEADQMKARLDLAIASTPSDQAAAQSRLDAATARFNSAKARADGTHQQLQAMDKTGWGFTVNTGTPLQVSLGTADGPLLGLQAGLAIGLGPASLSLGSLAFTLPNVQLTDTGLAADGSLAASTNDLAYRSDSDLVARQQMANLTLNLGALIGGNPSFGVGPLSVNVNIINYALSWLYNLGQDVSMKPDPTQSRVSFAFLDDATGSPTTVDVTVNGVTSTGVNSIDFVPGSTLFVKPQPGRSVRVQPNLKESYDFKNSLSLDFLLQGQLSVLGLSASVYGKTLLSTGYAYKPDANQLVGGRLLPLWSNQFDVTPPAVSLPEFTLRSNTSDVSVSVASAPETISLEGVSSTVPVTIEWNVANNGPIPATGVVFRGTLPKEYTFVGGRSTSGLSVDANNVVTLSLGNIPSGQTRRIVVSADLPTSFGSYSSPALWSNASVTSTSPDPIDDNNTAGTITNFTVPFHIPIRTLGDINDFSNPDFETVRAGVHNAESHFGPDITYFALSVIEDETVFNLDFGEMVVTQSLSVLGVRNSLGAPRVVLNQRGDGRIFRFGGSGRNNYVVQNLIFRGGDGRSSPDAGSGMAILLSDPDGSNPATRDTLTVINCVFENNGTDTTSGLGGAICVINGDLVVRDSTFRNNVALGGGAISMRNGSLTLEDTVIQANSARNGGAVQLSAFPTEVTTADISDSSIIGNTAQSGSGVLALAQGINNQLGGQVRLKYKGTIVANNPGGAAPVPNFASSFVSGGSFTVTSQGNNIVNDGSGNATAGDDRPNTQPGIFLSSSNVLDDPAGSIVGVLALVDPAAYSNSGYTVDDSRFIVDGATLKLKPGQASLGQPGGSVNVTITATVGSRKVVKAFGLTIVQPNYAPTDVRISAATIAENTSGAVLIGSLTATDPNAGDIPTFRVDDPRFNVENEQLWLRSGYSLDFEAEPTVTVRITARDFGGLTFTKPITIRVTDANESPTRVILAGGAVPGGVPGGTIGRVTVIDPDSGPAPTVSVDDPRFEVVGGILRLKAGNTLLRGDSPTVSLRLTATDSGGLSLTQPFELRVTPGFQATATPRTFTEHGAAVALLDSVQVLGRPDDSFDGAHLVVTVGKNGRPSDRVTIENQGTGTGQIGLTGNSVLYEGRSIGSFVAKEGGALDVAFASAAATPAAVAALMRSLRFGVSGDKPSTATRQLDVSWVDSGGSRIGVAPPVSVAVVALPRFVVGGPSASVSVKTNAALAFKGAALISVAAVPGNRSAIVRLSVNAGTLSVRAVRGLTVRGGGSSTVTLTGTLKQINQSLAGLSYRAPRKVVTPVTLNISAADRTPTDAAAIQPNSRVVGIQIIPPRR